MTSNVTVFNFGTRQYSEDNYNQLRDSKIRYKDLNIVFVVSLYYIFSCPAFFFLSVVESIFLPSIKRKTTYVETVLEVPLNLDVEVSK